MNYLLTSSYKKQGKYFLNVFLAFKVINTCYIPTDGVIFNWEISIENNSNCWCTPWTNTHPNSNAYFKKMQVSITIFHRSCTKYIFIQIFLLIIYVKTSIQTFFTNRASKNCFYCLLFYIHTYAYTLGLFTFMMIIVS